MPAITLKTPLGTLLIRSSTAGITEIKYLSEEQNTSTSPSGNTPLKTAVKQLTEYFKGNRKIFSIPLDLQGSSFQLSVWTELQNIPWGTTLTYAELAKKLDNPKAIRAVGTANGQNPIPIIIPCHRVIGSKGKLTGYSGGIDKKRWLLKHENALLL